PGTDLRENLALAPGEPQWVASGRGPGAGRDGPCAERAQPLPGDPGRGGRAELGEGAQRLPQPALLGRVQPDQRGLVRAAQVGPQLRGLLLVAVEQQLVGLGQLGPWPPGGSGAAQPHRQRTGQPGVARIGHVISEFRLAGRFSGPSSQYASTRAPVSAATSSSCRESAPRPAARASTASRAEAGTCAIPACRTSVT